LHLAATFGCRVTGLDLIDVSVAQATERARSKGLERLTDFHEGDATAMPFDDASFDLVWGQDAWCHVVDKSRLIAECVRVLVAGGTIAFTDWLVTGEMARSDREDLLSAAASETMETFDGYRALLIDHGFSIVDEADVSATFVEQFDAIMADLETLQASISSQFSPRVYDIVLEKNGIITEAFRSGAMGGGRFIAKKL
jgi:ubiquinone/menaquinone biosynthesis C-methylase UbiE